MTNYAEMRRRATILSDRGDYNHKAAEMNPAIFEMLVSQMKQDGLPLVIWEPFAGTSWRESNPRSVAQDYAEANGIELLSYGLAPRDPRIQVKDSTKEGPRCLIGGVLFHPPYPGSIPLSEHFAELSRKDLSWNEYLDGLKSAIRLAAGALVEGGIVCAVGADYRAGGERVRLDAAYVELFESESFVLFDVWNSEPDVVLAFKRR